MVAITKIELDGRSEVTKGRSKFQTMATSSS